MTNQRSAVQACRGPSRRNRAQRPPCLIAQAAEEAGQRPMSPLPNVMPPPWRAESRPACSALRGVAPGKAARTSPGNSARARTAGPVAESASASASSSIRRSMASCQSSASLATSRPETSCWTQCGINVVVRVDAGDAAGAVLAEFVVGFRAIENVVRQGGQADVVSGTGKTPQVTVVLADQAVMPDVGQRGGHPLADCGGRQPQKWASTRPA